MSAVRGLAALPAVQLGEPALRQWQHVRDLADGDRVWRERKCAEARDLLAMAAIAPRMQVAFLDAQGDLRAVVRLRTPVPCRVPPGPVSFADAAMVGIVYRREALCQALPGVAFATLLQPAGVYLANVHPGPVQRLCLGTRLPPGTRVTEIVLMTYRALTLQEATLDERDPAGVLHLDAARYWQEHAARMPLTAAPFLAADADQEVLP